MPQSDSQGAIDRMEKVLALEEHPGWKILMSVLANDSAQAVNDFMKADPRDGDAIAAIQDRIKRYQWLAGALENVVAMGTTELANQEQQEAEDPDGQED